MSQTQLTNLLLDQSKDLIWIIDLNFQLVYANKKYLNLMKEMTGVEIKLNESVFVEGFGEGHIEKWKACYTRALNGAYFEIEEHYHHPVTNELQYTQVTFEPLTGDDHNFFAVACVSKDIKRVVKERSEANQMIDASLAIFCTINEQGNFVYVSAAAANHWGYLPEELIGKPYLDMVVEEDLPKTIETAATVLGGYELKSFVNRFKKKNGDIAYNLWSVKWDDIAKLLYCVAIDGKEKIEQEEKILQSEQRFKALVQEGSDLITIIDAMGNYSYVSPTSISILGMLPEEFIGVNVSDFVHPEDAETVLAILEKITTENKIIIEPFRFQNHKKEWRWMESVFTNMLDNPTVKGIVVNSRDVTDKIEEKHKLKLLESVITNTNDAILITEAEPFDEPGNKIIYVNEAFTKMTGYEAEEVIGKTPRMLQGPNSNKEGLAKLGRSIRNWEPCELTTINYKKSGEEFWITFTLTPVTNEKGAYTHWIAIERDVTEQKFKELENELLVQISENFNADNDYKSASNEVCTSISKFGNFDWVEIWTVNLENNEIQLFSHCVAAPEDEKFYDLSREINAFKISESMAGKVWSDRTQILWDNIEDNKDFVRRDAAKKIGLKAVFGIPLIFNNEVVGVLNIGTKHSANYLNKYTQIFQRLVTFIGSELNRKKLENDLSHLFNAIPDILCLLDLKGRFLRINKAGCDLMGYSEEDVLYHHFEEFVHSEDRAIFSNEVIKLKNEETTFKFENRFITSNGEVIWLSWYCNATLKDGIIYATAKNITEEKKLKELNSQARSLAKISSWEVDLSNQKVFWSEEAHQLHETDPKTFVPNLQTGIKSFIREDFHQSTKYHIDNCITTGEPFDFEAVLVTAKKNEVWVRVIGNAEFKNGVCKRIYGSFQNIQDRKQAEIRLQSLTDNLTGVVFQYLIYPDGTDAVKYVSRGSLQVWGFSPEQVIQNPQLVWDGVLSGGDIEEFKNSITESIISKTKWTTRWKYMMPSGEIKTLLGSSSPNFLSDGTVLFNTLILDVTQEVKNEGLLTQVTKMARMGSWELDLINQNGDSMYWSPMVKEILEVEDTYNPTLTGGLEFYIGESKERIQHAVTTLISECLEFDEELLLLTSKGNERWIRCIGKSETTNNKPTKIYGSFQDISEQKIAAGKLQKAFEEKNKILESIGDAFFAVDNEGIVTYWNKQAELVMGKKKELIVGKYLWQEYADAMDSDFFLQFQKAMKTREVAHFEAFSPKLNIWIEVSGYPAEDGLSVYFKDITLRKEAEENIKDSEEKNRLIMNAALDAIICIDLKGNVIFWNPQAEKIFGWLPNEIIGKKLSNYIIPENLRSMHESGMSHYLNTGESKIFKSILELSAINKGGDLFPVELTVIPIKQGDEEFFCGFIRDITQRKKAEESILQANKRFEKVTEATNDSIWDWDIEKKTYYRSKAFERFFGIGSSGSFPESELWSRDYFHPEDIANIKNSFDKAIANPLTTRWELEFRVIIESGEILYVIDRAVIIRNKEGKAIRVVGAMTDISEQKQMTVQLTELNKSLKQYTAELERSNEELEQFAFVASHDLQEPLRMISSFMELLQRKYGDLLDEKGHKYIGFATDGAKRMKQIILDLLDYSRAGRPTEAKEVVDLNKVLADFKLLRSQLIEEKNALIKSDNLPTLSTYNAAITQILHCLLDNALKYSIQYRAPIVEMKAVENENEWEFSVKDNGIGIDPQFYNKIFIIFQRLHNNEQYAGTGIGLSITKRHVEFLGGRIWLKSVPGEGTTFYFTIPKNA